jgi:hypothetical protein
MADRPREVVARVDAYLAANPDVMLNTLALELDLPREVIEQAIREAGARSFREYQENKRLAQALELLRLLPPMPAPGSGAACDIQRVCPRFVIPGATICYRVHGPGICKHDFSRPYPVANLSRSGLAFLTDRPPRARRRVSLLLKFSATEAELRLEGRVVYTQISRQTSYPYRAGIKLLPFAAQMDCNARDVLWVLEKSEQNYVSRDTARE